VRRVGVLHGELARADQAAAGARLVAELGLYLVEHQRELAVRCDILAQQVGHDLLMGHRQDGVAPGAVREARQFGADIVPAAGLLPQLGRLHDRQRHLLAADPVHLLA